MLVPHALALHRLNQPGNRAGCGEAFTQSFRFGFRSPMPLFMECNVAWLWVMSSHLLRRNECEHACIKTVSFGH
jgi:hypothetical protein